MAIIWKFGDQSQENANNFRTMTEWWKLLQAKDVLWKQRLIPESGEIDWSPQKYDESMTLFEADVRGITFYWRKQGADSTGDITPAKAEFDPASQRIYLYPENQKDLVISVESKEPVFQTIALHNPDCVAGISDGGGYDVVLLDQTNHIKVQITLDTNSLNSLKQSICNL